MNHATTFALLLAAALSVGCTNRIVAVQAAATRTYSADVKPITGDQRCYQCHLQQKGAVFADGLKQLGTYSFDRANKVLIKTMVQVDANAEAQPATGFLSEAQARTVLDWIAAGMPDDGTPF